MSSRYRAILELPDSVSPYSVIGRHDGKKSEVEDAVERFAVKNGWQVNRKTKVFTLGQEIVGSYKIMNTVF